jgi:hypothetical protein
VYVSFQSNGQIRLDEVAILSSVHGRFTTRHYDWETGLLNFGLPLSGYNIGDLVNDPKARLQFWPVGGSLLQGISAKAFASRPIDNQTYYPQASISRIAVWGSARDGVAGVLDDKNHGIINDQIDKNKDLKVQANESWITCGSGQFESPPATPYEDFQYWPQQLVTPCNYPKAVPGNIKIATGAVTAKVQWDPIVDKRSLPVLNYVLNVNGKDYSTYLDEVEVDGLAPSSTYTATLRVVNAAGEGDPVSLTIQTREAEDVAFWQLNGEKYSSALCADEGQKCKVNASGTIAAYGSFYGGMNHITYQAQGLESFSCTAAHFFTSPDPNPNERNSCYLISGPTESLPGASLCAMEDTSDYGYMTGSPNIMSDPISAVIAFGTGSSWVYAAKDGPFDCSVKEFNADPAPGQAKRCLYYFPNDTIISSLKWCADEGGACNAVTATRPNIVAFGEKSRFFFMDRWGTFWCQTSTFGIDPLPGVTKKCLYGDSNLVPAAPAGVSATYCATEHNGNHPTCLVPRIEGEYPVIYYGTQDDYHTVVLPRSTEAIACAEAAFDRSYPDPAPGKDKYCWYGYR